MNILFSNSLGYRFASYAYLLAFIVGLLVTFFFIWLDYEHAQEQFFDNTRAILSSGSQTSSVAVYHLNFDLSQIIVEDLIEYPAIVYAVIVDHNGKAISRARRSSILSPYRWISDAVLGKNTRMQQPLYSPPPKEEFLGYLIIEVDTFIVGKSFLQRSGTVLSGGLTLTLLLSTLLIWLNRRQLIQPIHALLSTLINVNPHHPGSSRLGYPSNHHLDEIGAWIEHTNKLIGSIDTNIQRRDRAENDLRKNLGSIEHIVSERTEILRDQNLKLHEALSHAEQHLNQRPKPNTRVIISGAKDTSLPDVVADVIRFLQTNPPFPLPDITTAIPPELCKPLDYPAHDVHQLLCGVLMVAAEACTLSCEPSPIHISLQSITPIPDGTTQLNGLAIKIQWPNLSLDPDTFLSLLDRPTINNSTTLKSQIPVSEHDATLEEQDPEMLWHKSCEILQHYQAGWAITLTPPELLITLDNLGFE